MASYVVTGASRGLGYAFVKHFAETSSSNIVVGLVRNKSATDAKLKEDGIKNVTIIEADVVDRAALAKARDQVAKLTGGKLDYLLNNAASLGGPATFKPFTDFGASEADGQVLEDELLDTFKVNVVGVINVTNAFMPLILKSQVKKVVLISSGMGDIDLTNEYDVWEQGPYSTSKVAANMVVAKYNAYYKKDGVLFFSISPGVVDTGHGDAFDNDEARAMLGKFARYAPHWKGPLTPQESVEMCMKVIEEKGVEKGDGGAFVSQLGNKQWL